MHPIRLPFLRQSLVVLAAAAAYYALARLGLALTAYGEGISPFWPASGLAVALAFRCGSFVLPAVWLGTAVSMSLAGESLPFATLVGLLNAATAAACAWLLRRLRFRRSLERPEDVLLFGGVAVVGPMMAAHAAAALLVALGQPASAYGSLFLVWWVGDAIGVLVTAPALLTWERPRRRQRALRVLEGAGLAACTLVVAGLVFGTQRGTFWSVYASEILVFPLLIWAAMRFGPQGAAATLLCVGYVAFAGTALGRGPFAGDDLTRGEYGLGLCLAVGALSALLLAAVNAARERAVSERQAILTNAIRSERLAAVGTLAAGAAHEINNPLASVVSNLGYLGDRLAAQADAAEVRAVIEESLEGTERIRRIVEDLRFFARGRSGAGGAPIELGAAVDVAVRMAEHALRGRAELVEERGPTPYVRADAGEIGQVVLNLLLNAAQAIPAGARRREVCLRTATADDGWAIVEVRDTGSGIAPDVLPRIFEPFFTTRPVGAGTGLGLSTCHEIVAACGGAIEVRTHVGEGSTFCVRLPPHVPGAAPAASSARAAGAPADEVGAGMHLLRVCRP